MSGERGTFGFITRRFPGTVWLRVAVNLSGQCHPGHSWMYRGMVRRDTFTVAGRGLVVMFMPQSWTPKREAAV